MSPLHKTIEPAEIIPDKCLGCQVCMAECPFDAIKEKNGSIVIDPELCRGCGKCADVCPAGAVKLQQTSPQGIDHADKGAGIMADDGTFGDYRGVGVFIEVLGGAAVEVSWELVGKARNLADILSTIVIGFVVGTATTGVAREAITYGCDEVYVLDDPSLKTYLSKPYGRALADLCRKTKPEALLIGATAIGRDLAGITATYLETGLTADCTGLDIHIQGRLLLMTRPTFGGNIMATIFCEHRRPQMSTVRAGVFRKPEKDNERTGKIYSHPYDGFQNMSPEVLETITIGRTDAPDITRSKSLVVAGRGACEPESMPMLQELADLLGGVVACSRPVVETGLMPYERQVGQTGKTVAPDLYLAIGVSGAVQHLVGMQGSERIIAINSDPHAPIFSISTSGIVGDYRKVVPVLINSLQQRLSHPPEGRNHGKI
ncbi:MAG TPA: electron transfer flavoprotein subunit alpha [Syntrophorhabdaceae bacterium]|nr:electron transfer flavoprotein subunit alpha [Syntrophorhabdaceae bacterium]